MPPTCLSLLILTLVGCNPDGSDSAAASPFEMPDYGGCSYVFTRDDGADGAADLSSTMLYDAEGRWVAYDIVYVDYYTQRETRGYDPAGCNYAYDGWLDYDEAVYGDEPSEEVSYTQICNTHLDPVTREGLWNGTAYTVAYTWEYEDDLAVHLTAVTANDSGSEVTEEWLFGWQDGLLVSDAYTLDGTPIDLEVWTYDADGNVLSDQVTDCESPDDGSTHSWTYDAQGRYVTEMYERVGDGVIWEQSVTWYDEIYQMAELTERDDGAEEVGGIESWDCTLAWPWSCTWAWDGASWNDELPDGTPDWDGTETWECP